MKATEENSRIWIRSVTKRYGSGTMHFNSVIETVGFLGSSHRGTSAKNPNNYALKNELLRRSLGSQESSLEEWLINGVWSLPGYKGEEGGEGEALGVVCDLWLARQIWGFSSDPGVGCRCSRWTGKLQVRSSRVWMSSIADWLERLVANAKVTTVLGSIPASSDTVESEGPQMKQCWVKYMKRKSRKPCKKSSCKNNYRPRMSRPSSWAVDTVDSCTCSLQKKGIGTYLKIYLFWGDKRSKLQFRTHGCSNIDFKGTLH